MRQRLLRAHLGYWREHQRAPLTDIRTNDFIKLLSCRSGAVPGRFAEPVPGLMDQPAHLVMHCAHPVGPDARAVGDEPDRLVQRVIA